MSTASKTHEHSKSSSTLLDTTFELSSASPSKLGHKFPLMSPTKKIEDNIKADYFDDINAFTRKHAAPKPDFLARHQIDEPYRAKMVDWVVEVFTAFKCCDAAFFTAIQTLDRYFASVPKELLSRELHLTGITCMFMASKYDDVKPLLMRTVHSKIGHSKFTEDQFHDKELEILRTLGFHMGVTTPY